MSEIKDGFAVATPEGWNEILYGRDFVLEDTQFRYDDMVSMSPQKRTALGIKQIVVMEIPEGKRPVGDSFLRGVAGRPVRTWQLEDIVASPPPVPNIISDRQFGHGLFRRNLISYEECLAFVATGVIPAQLQEIIDSLPTVEMREDATILVAGAKEYDIRYPLTDAIRQSFGWTQDQLLSFWGFCASL